MIYINTYIYIIIYVVYTSYHSSNNHQPISLMSHVCQNFKHLPLRRNFPSLIGRLTSSCLQQKRIIPAATKAMPKYTKGPMFDAPNMAESLNMSSFVAVQGGISSACDIFEYLHLCAFMCLPSAPRQSASQRPRGCVCNAHPCWNDQGVVHKCPGDRKEDSWAVSDLGGDGENLETFFENHRLVWSVTNHPIPIWPILIVDYSLQSPTGWRCLIRSSPQFVRSWSRYMYPHIYPPCILYAPRNV